jgi:hypothetical protein
LTGSRPEIAGHDQKVTHHYLLHYPSHLPRADDPHYVDFEAYHRAHREGARCEVGLRIGFDECRDAQGNPAMPGPTGIQPGLELHHAHIEFALQNGVDLKALEHDYPGVSNPDEVGAWVESGANFMWLCAFHHRGHGGAHTASASDFEAEHYVKGLIS